MALPSTAEELGDLIEQEERLVFERFDHRTGRQLGTRLLEEADRQGLPVVVAVILAGQRLFHAALPGTTAENDGWVDRKARVVQRFGHSSLRVGTQARIDGLDHENIPGLDPAEYAAHGGAFPITVRGTGVVGAVIVSGLPQLKNHRFVVEQLTAFLADQQDGTSRTD